MHDDECPICQAARKHAPYRTQDRRGVPIEHPEHKQANPSGDTLRT